MALLGLQPPPAFLECLGKPKVEFDVWKKLFVPKSHSHRSRAGSCQRKRVLLIHCWNRDSTTPYPLPPIRMMALSRRCRCSSPRVNVVALRYRLRQCAQAVGESIHHYLAALRELARCNSGAIKGEMLHDQIVEKICTPRIRERAWTNTWKNRARVALSFKMLHKFQSILLWLTP